MQDHSGRDSLFIFLPPKPPGTSLFRDNLALDEIYRKMKMKQLKEEQTEDASQLKRKRKKKKEKMCKYFRLHVSFRCSFNIDAVEVLLFLFQFDLTVQPCLFAFYQ